MRLPLCVVTDPAGQKMSDGSRCYGGFYIREILAHAGIPYDEMERPLVDWKDFAWYCCPGICRCRRQSGRCWRDSSNQAGR